MFNSFAVDEFDASFDVSNPPPYRKRKIKPSVKVKKENEQESADPFSRRHQRILMMTRIYRAENERLRKPCPTCQTLVKPSLQQQHDDAYHPSH